MMTLSTTNVPLGELVSVEHEGLQRVRAAEPDVRELRLVVLVRDVRMEVDRVDDDVGRTAPVPTTETPLMKSNDG